nr:uncharacterized mitochondrial protein AtMg00810-like [Tanacetum cinerariifolium]
MVPKGSLYTYRLAAPIKVMGKTRNMTTSCDTLGMLNKLTMSKTRSTCSWASSFLFSEKVYVSQPDRFVDPDLPEKVYHLRKALYGLKQAPKAWYDELSKFLIPKVSLKAKYALEILKKHSIDKCDSIGTPMDTKPKLDANLSGTLVDQTRYKKDKWWQYDVDNWAGVVYDSKGNIVSVRDEYGNWSPFQIQEVAAAHDQELVHVHDQEVKNANDQKGENDEDQTDSIKTKRVMAIKNDVVVEGVKSCEHDGVNSAKNESQTGLVSKMGKGLGLKRHTVEDEDEHQEGLIKRVKKRASATGNTAATSLVGHGAGKAGNNMNKGSMGGSVVLGVEDCRCLLGLCQKDSGVGRGVKEKSLNMRKMNNGIGLSTASDGTCNEVGPVGDTATVMEGVTSSMIDMTMEKDKLSSLEDTTVLGSFLPLSTSVTTSAGNATGKSSYANITGKPSGKIVNVRTFFTPRGKKAAYHVVANYVRNTWGSSYVRVIVELRADMELKYNIVVAMPEITREGHYTCNVRVENNTCAGEKKTVKKHSQTSRGVLNGVVPTVDVSNSNPFDAFNSVDNDEEFGTNGGTTNLVNNEDTSSKLRLLDNYGNPLFPTGIMESDSEVDVVFDETTNLRISTSGKDESDKGYGTNILLEQWRDSYLDNDDYVTYDDDMYENHDLPEHL